MTTLRKRRVGVVVVSDRAFSAASTGSSEQNYNQSGAVIRSWLADNAEVWQVGEEVLCNDDPFRIKSAILDLLPKCDLLLLSGGTGLSPRDNTSLVVEELLDKRATGLEMLLISESLKITQFACLSNPRCGVKDRTLIVTLPGSPRACIENLNILATVMPHAVQLAVGNETNDHPVLAPHLNAQPILDVKSGCRCDMEVQSETRSAYEMISFDAAREILHSHAMKFARQTQVYQAKELFMLSKPWSWLTVAEDLYSQSSVPAFNTSYVDGYAFFMDSDLLCGTRFSLKQVSHDMAISDIVLERNECLRVNTGCLIPQNTNAIIMIEDTRLVHDKLIEYTGDSISLDKSIGMNLRPIGSDLTKEERIFKCGDNLKESDVGLVISAGIEKLKVYKKPIVAVISTGSELKEWNDFQGQLPPGFVLDTNRPCLIELFQRHGFHVVDLGIIRDDRTLLLEAIQKAMRSADVIVTSGGVSMGERDFIKSILVSDMKGEVHFGRLRLKPGKPMVFATIGTEKFFFGLPGNPVSSLVTSNVLVVPFLKKISGFMNCEPMQVRAKLINGSISLDPRPQFVRAKVWHDPNYGCLVAESTGNQVSSRLKSMKDANALLILKEKTRDKQVIDANDFVDALLI